MSLLVWANRDYVSLLESVPVLALVSVFVSDLDSDADDSLLLVDLALLPFSLDAAVLLFWREASLLSLT